MKCWLVHYIMTKRHYVALKEALSAVETNFQISQNQSLNCYLARTCI